LDVIEPVRKLIYDLRNEHEVAFLTALPFDEHSAWQHAARDKFCWVDTEFPGVPMFVGPYAHDKQKHCKTGDILVDDRCGNCDDWNAAGGITHLFRAADECRQWFKGEGYNV
jgi:hypothetical protein